MLRTYFARLPLTDRITHWWDLWSALCMGVFSGGCLTFLSVAARRSGVSDAGMAFMLTMPYVGMLSGVLLGHLADRHGPMPFFTWPTAASRAVLLALPFTAGPAGFLAFASAHHLLGNLGGPSYASLMRSNFSEHHRARLMGNVRILVVVVTGLVSWGAGALLETRAEAWRWVFGAATVVGLLAVVFFSRIKARRATSAAAGTPGLAAALRVLRGNGAFLGFLAAQFLCALPGKLAAALEPIRFVDELHIGWQDAGFVLGTVGSLVSVGGFLAWPRLLRRASPFVLLALVTALAGVRYGVIAMASRPLHLLPVSALGGFLGAGWEIVALYCVLRLVEPARFSVAMGLHTTLVGVRGLLGPSVGTWLYASGTLGLREAFWLFAAVSAAGAALMLAYAVRRSRAEVARLSP
jgi:hypothetical protein